MRIHNFCCCCCCCWEISLSPSPCNHARNSFEKKMFWLSRSYKKLTLIFLSYPVPCHRLSFSAKINSGQELSAFFWYMHALTLNYPLQYAKRFSNILQRMQQLFILLLYESLVGHSEYTTQPKGSIWCQSVDTSWRKTFITTVIMVV